ncbi:substrate-binding domain-containing protein [Maridesulfovibrio sp.]|uniref:substrate-binding domain-containing protein n=1 Tax=unclassified Maridesulfovibrio TaxID=2794999 RepID=UPI003AFFD06D
MYVSKIKYINRAAQQFSRKPAIALLLIIYILCFPCASQAQKTVVFIPKATILHYWKIVCTGAHAAIQNTDVNLIWRGSRVEEKLDAQKHLLEFYTDKKVDAIILAPADKERLNPYIEKAVETGIKVVIIDSPVTTKAPHAYIATGNYESGQSGAELLIKDVSKKGPLLLIGHRPDNGASYLREQGFIDRINELSPGRSIIRLHMTGGSERETRITVGEILDSIPGIAGIFSVNEPTSDGVLHVLNNHPDKDIPFVAFDYNQHLLQGIKEGKVNALITQKPYAMGFFGVRAALDLLDGKKIPKIMYSPVTIITPKNVEVSMNLKCLRKIKQSEKEHCAICFN